MLMCAKSELNLFANNGLKLLIDNLEFTFIFSVLLKLIN